MANKPKVYFIAKIDEWPLQKSKLTQTHATARFLVVVFAFSQVSDDIVEQIPVSHTAGDSK
ncbi:MAG: hypothetical protein ACYSUY_01985 [Planctomycetota bacterium]|jgi:hypothetical protein